MEGELWKGLTRSEGGKQGILAFPTNRFLLAAAVAGRDRVKNSSGFVGTVGIEWGGRPGNKGPVMNATWSGCDTG